MKAGEHKGECLMRSNGYEVIDCVTCGFRHITPIPTQDELDALYLRAYYEETKPDYIENYRKDNEWWDVVYGDRFAYFEELRGGRSGALLDIGSGPGLFLEHGKRRGWKVLGVEPNVTAAAYSRSLGVEVIGGNMTAELASKLGGFDVVHMSEVLEHLPDPAAMLSIASGVLPEGGLLCVVVPNDFNPFQKVLHGRYGFDPWWVAAPHHINYFDFDSLRRLMSRTGYDVVVEQSTFPIDMFLMMGDDYVRDPQLGRACHGRRMKLEMRLAESGLGDLRRRLYGALAQAGIGREVMMVGRKSGARA